MTPGSNLLAAALSVITPQAVWYYAWVDTVTDVAGIDRSEYAPRVKLWGSWQPVSRSTMAQQGLDMSKDYAVFYASRRFLDVGRDVAGDQLGFDGQRWQAMGKTGWFAQDGWDCLMVVSVGSDAGN